MRFLLVLLLFCTGPVPAASAAGTELDSSQLSASFYPQRHAGFTDYVIGNRSRMIQVTTIAFGLGLVILMTSTRKH
jgi:hypothetical protein